MDIYFEAKSVIVGSLRSFKTSHEIRLDIDLEGRYTDCRIEISINDAEFHDKLYAPQPAVRDRHPHFSAFLGTTKGSFSTPEHFLHRRRRTAYSPFFSLTNVAASEDLLRKQVDDCFDLLWSCKDSDLNLRAFFAALSFDGFYRWAFGAPLGLLNDLDLADHCYKAVETMVTSAPLVRVFPWMMLVARRVPHTVLRRLSRHIARVFDLYAVISALALS